MTKISYSGNYVKSKNLTQLDESKSLEEPFEWKKEFEVKNEHSRTIYSINWSKDDKYIATGSGKEIEISSPR
jgi:hypothetical protein